MYAIIRSGGKQYRVAEDSVVRLELLDAEVGSKVELNDIALLGGGSQVHIGTPVVDGSVVLGKVVAHGRTRRIVVYKFKPKKGYHRRRGHRQNYHDVLIQQVLAPGEEPRRRQQAQNITTTEAPEILQPVVAANEAPPTVSETVEI